MRDYLDINSFEYKARSRFSPHISKLSSAVQGVKRAYRSENGIKVREGLGQFALGAAHVGANLFGYTKIPKQHRRR